MDFNFISLLFLFYFFFSSFIFESWLNLLTFCHTKKRLEVEILIGHLAYY